MSDTHRLPDGRTVIGAWMDSDSVSLPMVWVCVYSHQHGYGIESMSYSEMPQTLAVFGTALSSMGRTLAKLAAGELAKRMEAKKDE